jgi:hypothetical protein
VRKLRLLITIAVAAALGSTAGFYAFHHDAHNAKSTISAWGYQRYTLTITRLGPIRHGLVYDQVKKKWRSVDARNDAVTLVSPYGNPTRMHLLMDPARPKGYSRAVWRDRYGSFTTKLNVATHGKAVAYGVFMGLVAAAVSGFIVFHLLGHAFKLPSPRQGLHGV